MTDSYTKNIQQINKSSYGINDIRSGDKATELIKAKKGEKAICITDLTTGDVYQGYNGLDGYVGGLVPLGFKQELKVANKLNGAANIPIAGVVTLDGLAIPDNHIITKAFVYVVNSIVGSGASLAFSLEGESANFLKTATAITSLTAGDIVSLIPDEDPETGLVVSNGGGQITVTVSGAAVTAGDLLVFGELKNLNLSN